MTNKEKVHKLLHEIYLLRLDIVKKYDAAQRLDEESVVEKSQHLDKKINELMGFINRKK